jgi:hypothetical protein
MNKKRGFSLERYIIIFLISNQLDFFSNFYFNCLHFYSTNHSVNKKDIYILYQQKKKKHE